MAVSPQSDHLAQGGLNHAGTLQRAFQYYMHHIKRPPGALLKQSQAGDRSRVLKEAASVIREKGPDGVAVSDIMARAGLTHGGFYAHFASKDELVGEAVTAMFADVNAKIACTRRRRRWQGTLRNILAFYLSAEHRDNPSSGCPMPALSGDIARGDRPGARPVSPRALQARPQDLRPC